MFRRMHQSAFVAAVALSAFALSTAAPAAGPTAPRSNEAEPGVYKVLADGEGLRIVLATWQAGQRDAWHSHPASAYYWLTDCQARIHLPDGSYRDLDLKAGQSGVQMPIESHSFENRSATECRVLLVERM